LLRSGGRNLQKGNLGSYCWSHWSPGKGGTGICADADGFDFPSRVLVSAGDSVRIRLHHPEKPKRFDLFRWHEVDDDGQPVSAGERKFRKLRKVKRHGDVVAWDAVFTLRKRDRHYYLNAFVRWSQGDASYDFHVKTRE
jgi:hypothetical protein